jgi:hypothetical protein
MNRYIRDTKTRAVFLKDSSVLERRNAEIRNEERFQQMETEIHKLREMVEQLIKNQQERA